MVARSRAGLFVFLLLFASALVVVSRSDLRAMQTAFAEASWKWIAIGALVNLLSVVVDAVRWKAIVGAVRRVSLVSAVQALLVGWVSNVILPLKLGEGAKAWVMAKREGLPIATVISTVLLDRAMDGSALVLFVVLTTIIAPLPSSVQKARTWGLTALAVMALALVLGRRWVRARRREGAFLEGTLARVFDGFAILGQQHRLGRTVLIAVVAWLTRMAIVWCAMQAFDLMLPIAAAASVLVAINLGITAIAAPGNLGVFELSAVAGLALWGVRGETALSFGIALHALELIPTIVLGLLVQTTTRTPLRGPAM